MHKKLALCTARGSLLCSFLLQKGKWQGKALLFLLISSHPTPGEAAWEQEKGRVTC